MLKILAGHMMWGGFFPILYFLFLAHVVFSAMCCIGFPVFLKFRTPEPKDTRPHSHYGIWSPTVVTVLANVYGISSEITYIKQIFIVRIIDYRIRLCPPSSKVPFQHFQPPPDPSTQIIISHKIFKAFLNTSGFRRDCIPKHALCELWNCSRKTKESYNVSNYRSLSACVPSLCMGQTRFLSSQLLCLMEHMSLQGAQQTLVVHMSCPQDACNSKCSPESMAPNPLHGLRCRSFVCSGVFAAPPAT